MAGIKQINRTAVAPKAKTAKPRKARVKNQDRWLLKYLDDKLGYTKKWTTKDVFYPSMLGNACDRYLYLAYNGQLPDQTIKAQTTRIFDNGNGLEDRMRKYFERLGLFLAAEQSLRLANPPISGRYDFLLKHEEHGRIILELKSINQKGFDLLIEAPKSEHVVQLQIYLNLAEVSQGVVLYENKNDQTLKAFSITKDESLWNSIIERCIRIQNMLPEDMPKQCTGEFYCACRGVK
tara:strand:+ start:309 stop:1013 length:705 start_codon:yes stop_codon:yes gene_type:complete